LSTCQRLLRGVLRRDGIEIDDPVHEAPIINDHVTHL
jgi:hypothetical protein